MFLYMIWHI